MAVTRIQSINVSSSLPQVIAHRLSPPADKETLVDARVDVPTNTPETHLDNIADIEDYSSSVQDFLTEFIKYVESAGYTQKIRKNAVIQEIVIAYSSEDFTGVEESEVKYLIKKDVDLFLKFFKEKFGFRPYYMYFVHKNNSNMYHVHILFSLKKPDLKTKIRWKKRTYFELIKKLASESPRISIPHKGKNIGAYPLWLVRKLEEEYGRETAKEVVKLARKKGYSTRTLIENAEELVKAVTEENIREQQPPHLTP